jgi:hypothetical protein
MRYELTLTQEALAAAVSTIDLMELEAPESSNSSENLEMTMSDERPLMEEAFDNFNKVWHDAMEHCRVVLGDDDYDAIVVFQSPNQLITAIGNLEIQYSGGGTIPRLLNRIAPQLQTLSTFVTVVLIAMGPNTISTGCIWGAMSLLIQVSLLQRRFSHKI